MFSLKTRDRIPSIMVKINLDCGAAKGIAIVLSFCFTGRVITPLKVRLKRKENEKIFIVS